MTRKTPLEAAEELFASYRGPGSESTRIGEAALSTVLEGRDIHELSAAETHCVLKAYNWTFRHNEAVELAKAALKRWGNEFLPDLNIAFHNAYYWPKGAFVAKADELIREGVGPPSYWYMRKADWWVREATGEHDSEEEWYPGNAIADHAALDKAAIELDAAISHAAPGSVLPDATWIERYAPLLEQPRFIRFRPVASAG